MAATAGVWSECAEAVEGRSTMRQISVFVGRRWMVGGEEWMWEEKRRDSVSEWMVVDNEVHALRFE